jgi:hypothetical protein
MEKSIHFFTEKIIGKMPNSGVLEFLWADSGSLIAQTQNLIPDFSKGK